jgi:hypothetical protein
MVAVLFASIACWRCQGLEAKAYAVDVQVRAETSPPQIQFAWPALEVARQYIIRRKGVNEGNWSSTLATLPGDATGFIDNKVSVGSAFEYEIEMDTSYYPWPNGDPSQWINAYTYVCAGVNAPLIDAQG